MEKDNYFLENFTSHDGKNLVIHHWPVEKPKMLIHLVHGMSEHGYRYHDFAKWLNKKGIYAYAPDLRGHGKTAGSMEDIGLFSIKYGWNKVVKDLKGITEEFSSKKSKYSYRNFRTFHGFFSCQIAINRFSRNSEPLHIFSYCLPTLD